MGFSRNKKCQSVCQAPSLLNRDLVRQTSIEEFIPKYRYVVTQNISKPVSHQFQLLTQSASETGSVAIQSAAIEKFQQEADE